jgi:F-type H+-transporting ATPase subunit epsilon
MKVKVISSTKSIFESNDVSEIYAPATEGIVGIMPGHTNFISTLNIGLLKIKVGNVTTKIVLNGGMIQVVKDVVLVLADDATPSEALIKEEIETAISNAQKMMSSKIEPSELIRLEKMLRYEKFKEQQLGV